MEIVQTPKKTVFLFEGFSSYIVVPTDGRKHTKDPDPTWYGESIGWYEGDTLVVDTIGFNGRAWVDTGSGHPQTEAARVTERFTRRDVGHMDIDITIDDPKAYTKPFTVRVNHHLMVDQEMIEFICNENERSTDHIKK